MASLIEKKEDLIFKRVIRHMGGKSVNEQDVVNLLSVKADRSDIVDL